MEQTPKEIRQTAANVKLRSFLAENRSILILIALLIAWGGWWVFQNSSQTNFPPKNACIIRVELAQDGFTAEYMSENLLAPLEQAFGKLDHQQLIESVSEHGFGAIQIQFDSEIDAIDAFEQVKTAIDLVTAERDFPPLKASPSVAIYRPSEKALMSLHLRGSSPETMNRISKLLKNRLEGLSGLDRVLIYGAQTREMRIEVDPIKAQTLDVSLDEIEKAIEEEQIQISGGSLSADGMDKAIRIEGSFENAEALKKIILHEDESMTVRLEDVARVSFQAKETASIVRESGQEAIRLEIHRSHKVNPSEAAAQVKAALKILEQSGQIPNSIRISSSNDPEGSELNQQKQIKNYFLLGLILVLLIFYFFTSWQLMLRASVSIGLSFALTTIVLVGLNLPFHVILVFCGCLISCLYARFTSWKNLAYSVLALSLFVLPLYFLKDTLKEWMTILCWCFTASFLCTLAIRNFIEPVLNEFLTKIRLKEPRLKSILILVAATLFSGFILICSGFYFGGILLGIAFIIPLHLFMKRYVLGFIQHSLNPRVRTAYEGYLKILYRSKKLRIALLGLLALVLFIAALNLKEFRSQLVLYPTNDPNSLTIYVSQVPGSSFETSKQRMLEVEREVNMLLDYFQEKDRTLAAHERFIQSVSVQVGSDCQDPEQGISRNDSDHLGKICIQFAEAPFRQGRSTLNLSQRIRHHLSAKFPADVAFSFRDNQQSSALSKALKIEISGSDDYPKLIRQAEKINSFLRKKNIPGLEQFQLNVHPVSELIIPINHNRVRALNTSAYEVATAIRKALQGENLASYKQGKNLYGILLRFDSEHRFNRDALLDQELILRSSSGEFLHLPISAVIDEPEERVSYGTIFHRNGQPNVGIFSNISPGYKPKVVLEELHNYLREFQLLEGETELTCTIPEYDDQNSWKELFCLALLLTGILFLIRFRSYSKALIAVLSVLSIGMGTIATCMIVEQCYELILLIPVLSILSFGMLTHVINSHTSSPKNLSLEHISEIQLLQLSTPLRLIAGMILMLLPLCLGLNIDLDGLIHEFKPAFFLGGDQHAFFGNFAWLMIVGLLILGFVLSAFFPLMNLFLNSGNKRSKN